MGNSVSHCAAEGAKVRVQEALSGESTELTGSDASDNAQSPADTAPAVPVEAAVPAAESERVAGDIGERAKEALSSAKDVAESAMDTAVEAVRGGGAGEEESAGAGAGEEEEEESAEPGMKTVTLRTAPNDPRFPVSNQSRCCYVRYNEYYKCVRDRGEENQECKFIKRAYRSICPDEWIERWEEQRANGTWYGKY